MKESNNTKPSAENSKYKAIIYFKTGATDGRTFYSYPAYDKKGDAGLAKLRMAITQTFKNSYTTAIIICISSNQIVNKYVNGLKVI